MTSSISTKKPSPQTLWNRQNAKLRARKKGQWKCNFTLHPETHYGFIYLIKDLDSGEMYLGKKQYRNHGAKKKVIRNQQSDWKQYCSSSTYLKDRIKDRQRKNFEFIILEEYEHLCDWSYAETWSLMFVEVPSNNAKWLNRRIDGVQWKAKVGITERHKKNLKANLPGSFWAKLLEVFIK
ncbi:hypothetical protein N9N32_00260 [Alphaproteobacteria bacterium]|nr:hypothetical protein [Alphaproteobacteria bacterium]